MAKNPSASLFGRHIGPPTASQCIEWQADKHIVRGRNCNEPEHQCSFPEATLLRGGEEHKAMSRLALSQDNFLECLALICVRLSCCCFLLLVLLGNQ